MRGQTHLRVEGMDRPTSRPRGWTDLPQGLGDEQTYLRAEEMDRPTSGLRGQTYLRAEGMVVPED